MDHIFSFITALLPLAVLILLVKYVLLPGFKRDDFFAAKGEIKKISLSTPLLKRLGINTEDYYYDSAFLYQKRGGEALDKIPLENIILVKVSGTAINNRRMWRVRYLIKPYQTAKELRFLNNYTVFNRDFAGFLAAVQAANPDADVQKMTIWRV